MSGTPEVINSSTDALITLSSTWGIGLTILMIIILAIVAIVLVYLWKVAPIKAKQNMEALKQEMILLQQQHADNLAAEKAKLRQSGQMPAIPVDHSAKIKAIFAELDRIKNRLEKVENTCPEHREMLTDVVTKMKIINETIPQAIESIQTLNERVWDLATKSGGPKPR
jgi:type II secretory pathway pseudopilin PulG